MATEYEGVMKQLIRTVTRMFYAPHHVVIADILLEAILLSDTEFCERMKMLGREFNRLIMKLKDDKLIKQDVKLEVLENNRQNLKTIFFFDFAEVRSIIKYKIYKMTKLLETTATASSDMFYCSGCERGYSALDAQAMMDGFVFKCQFCDTELVEHPTEVDETKMNLKELLGKVNGVVELLKTADTYEIPALDYFQVLELKKEKEGAEEKTTTKGDTSVVAENEKMVVEIAQDDEDYESTEDGCKEGAVKTQEKSEEYVTVGGKRRKYSEITEKDIEAMDADEYTLYFDMYSRKTDVE